MPFLWSVTREDVGLIIRLYICQVIINNDGAYAVVSFWIFINKYFPHIHVFNIDEIDFIMHSLCTE